jgi:hypothetical protein
MRQQATNIVEKSQGKREVCSAGFRGDDGCRVQDALRHREACKCARAGRQPVHRPSFTGPIHLRPLAILLKPPLLQSSLIHSLCFNCGF